MKELNISNIIGTKRREKGVTQEELAFYFGVSKASVSKWETGQSYPDITLLPQLASYFNISIDTLLGYEPQMGKEDIYILYQELSSRFSSEPFHNVYLDCEEIIQKYFSCFPLLLQISVLYANYSILAPEPELGKSMLLKVVSLSQRIKTESGDPMLSKEALNLEATAYLMLCQPQKLLELFGESLCPLDTQLELVAQAWQMLDNSSKAIECFQVSSYQHLLILASSASHLMLLNADKPAVVNEIIHRTLSLIDLYHIDQLHPNTSLIFYLTSAQVFCTCNEKESALDMLKKYTNLAQNISEFTLHGDDYFDHIDTWFKDFPLGTSAPRDQQIIKQSLIQGITQNPAFSVLESEDDYQLLLKQLSNILGGNKS